MLETIKLAVQPLSFRVLRQLADEAGKTLTGLQRANRFSTEKIAWDVEAASRHMPGEKPDLPRRWRLKCSLPSEATRLCAHRRRQEWARVFQAPPTRGCKGES
jgi:hypothetical protein